MALPPAGSGARPARPPVAPVGESALEPGWWRRGACSPRSPTYDDRTFRSGSPPGGRSQAGDGQRRAFRSLRFPGAPAAGTILAPPSEPRIVTTPHVESSERVVWQGRPSWLVDLPFHLALVVGGALASVGLVLLLPPAAPEAADATTNARVVSWVLAGLWAAIVVLALARWLTRRSVRYVLTTQRLRITTGILSTVTEDIELRRVRDSAVERPFFQRIVGLGNVRVTSADPSHPRVVLAAVRDPDGLQDRLRTLVEGLIRTHGVRELDIM